MFDFLKQKNPDAKWPCVHRRCYDGEQMPYFKGDIKAIGGLVQQRYGETQESYDKKMEGIYGSLEAKKDAVVDATKDQLKNKH